MALSAALSYCASRTGSGFICTGVLILQRVLLSTLLPDWTGLLTDMAPSITFASAVQPSLYSRQDPAAAAPACFTECMGTVDLDGCDATDLACLCSSGSYVVQFGMCLVAGCSTAEYQGANAYSEALCAPYAGGLGGNGTSPVDDPTAPRATNNAYDARPVVIRVKEGPINTVMTVICTLLIAAALITGVFAIRSKLKLEAQMSRDREWTTAGSTTHTKDYGMRSKRSQPSSSRNQTSTFASSNFGQNSTDFGGSSGNYAMSPVKPSYNRRPDDHWVLGEEDEDGKSTGPITPGANSGFEVETLDYTATGSRVDLNPADVTDSNDKKEGGAGIGV